MKSPLDPSAEESQAKWMGVECPFFISKATTSVRSSFPKLLHTIHTEIIANQFLPLFIVQYTIRTARNSMLILPEYYDVMHMKSLQKINAPEFSDAMST